MLKVSWDAGHGLNTPGKRTPDNSLHEWQFNSEVVRYAMLELAKYDGVAQKRFDDPTGKRDVPLTERTNGINSWGSNLHISVHANAFGNGWNTADGIETYVYKLSLAGSVKIAKAVQHELVEATRLDDRGVKAGDLHMVRETNMDAILIENPFMTNKKEAELLKSDGFRRTCAAAIVRAIVDVYGLKKKVISKPKEDTKVPENNNKPSTWAKTSWEKAVKSNIIDGNRPQDSLTREEFTVILDRLGLIK